MIDSDGSGMISKKELQILNLEEKLGLSDTDIDMMINFVSKDKQKVLKQDLYEFLKNWCALLIILGYNIGGLIMQGNFKLQEKYEEDEGFRADMQKNERNYQSFLQEAIYADLSCINEDLLIRLDRANDQIYFYCAMHHKTKKS